LKNGTEFGSKTKSAVPILLSQLLNKLYGRNPKPSCKMRRTFLSDKRKAAACRNADGVGLRFTADHTISMFAVVRTECPLPVNDDITLPVALNLMNQFKIVFLEGIRSCFSTLNSRRNRCCLNNWFCFNICNQCIHVHVDWSVVHC
jgi:hypothetical protein